LVSCKLNHNIFLQSLSIYLWMPFLWFCSGSYFGLKLQERASYKVSKTSTGLERWLWSAVSFVSSVDSKAVLPNCTLGPLFTLYVSSSLESLSWSPLSCGKHISPAYHCSRCEYFEARPTWLRWRVALSTRLSS
jgi:hypothetical protein